MSRAVLKFIRLSPIKARLIAREVQGQNAEAALAALEFMPNKAAGIIARGLRRQRRLVAFPWQLVLAIRLGNMVPAPIADFFAGGFAAEIEPDPRDWSK